MTSLIIVLVVGIMLFTLAVATAPNGDTGDRASTSARPLRRLLVMARQGLAVLRSPLPAAGAIVLQTAGWVLQLFAVYVSMRAFNIHAPLPAAGLVLLLMNVATIFPLWPGNFGLLQAAVALPLVQYGVAYSTGFAYAIVLQFVEMSVGVGVGLIFLAREGLSFAMLRHMPDASELRDADEEEERAASGGGPCARWRVRLASRASSRRRLPQPHSRRGFARAAPKPTSFRSPTAARERRRRCGSRSAASGSRPRCTMRSAARGARVGFVLPDGSAVVEAAAAVPLDPLRLDPLAASSRGFGELVAAVLDDGPTALLLALGGTATMDAGAGFLEVVQDLRVPARVACDVTATLAEAPRLFGPQKGAGPAEIAELERRFAAFPDSGPGGGAAGGLGAALASLGAILVPGASLVLDAIGFEPRAYDLVVTGEGRVDSTTLLGKAPGEVVRRSLEAGTRCVVFGGLVAEPLPDVETDRALGRPGSGARRPRRAGEASRLGGLGRLPRVGFAQLVRECLDELPRDAGVGLDDRAELPERHRVGLHVRVGGDGCRARALVDQRDLAEVVAGAERGPVLAVHGDLRVPLADDEEAGAALTFARDRVAGGVVPLLERVGDPLEVALLEAREQGHSGDRLGRGAGHRAILSRVVTRRKRCRLRGALRQLLDLPLGGLETRKTEAQQLLAALPELDRLVEAGVASLEPLDDLLQLLLGGLEGQLAHFRTSSTRAPKPPSASSTSTRVPCASPSVSRSTESPARTIA